MDTVTMIVAVVVILVTAGAVIALRASRRRSSERLQGELGPEYDRTVQAMGGEKKAQTELEQRRKRVEALNIRPLAESERAGFLAAWTTVQANFPDDPGQAIVDADHLIKQVMRARAYPVADFEQRAADVSVSYPALVSDYRAAQEIALKNEQHQANTEELRQAVLHYRSLFNELLGESATDVEDE